MTFGATASYILGMKRAGLALVLIAVAAGCGSGGETLADTHLTLTALNPTIGLAAFHLTCAPVGGDLPDAAAACSALRRDPGLVTAPKPFVCIGGTASWWDVTISGRLDGKAVRQKFSTCWTSQMKTIGELGLEWTSLRHHLVPRRHGVVAAGQTRTFPAGALRPGDVVRCTIQGHAVELGVTDHVGTLGSSGFGGMVNTTLTASRHADGSVTARCSQGTS
ncbi:MAG: Subtilisin inhibitor-like [Gaiellaceae bacterium]|nr:Subtilisin inhibitor-like [Gaiellaceae bacterium]